MTEVHCPSCRPCRLSPGTWRGLCFLPGPWRAATWQPPDTELSKQTPRPPPRPPSTAPECSSPPPQGGHALHLHKIFLGGNQQGRRVRCGALGWGVGFTAGRESEGGETPPKRSSYERPGPSWDGGCLGATGSHAASWPPSSPVPRTSSQEKPLPASVSGMQDKPGDDDTDARHLPPRPSLRHPGQRLQWLEVGQKGMCLLKDRNKQNVGGPRGQFCAPQTSPQTGLAHLQF